MNTISDTNRELNLQDLSRDLTLAELDRIAGGVNNCFEKYLYSASFGERYLNLTSRIWEDSDLSKGPVAHGVRINAIRSNEECGI
jgi:hypothetical protein